MSLKIRPSSVCDCQPDVRYVQNAEVGKSRDRRLDFRSRLVDGRLFRPVNRGDKLQGEAMSEKVVWQMLQPYATDAGVSGIVLHDCRSAKLCRAAWRRA